MPKIFLWFFFFSITQALQAQVKADVIIKSYHDLQTPYIDVYSFILQSALKKSADELRSVESLLIISNNSEIVIGEKYLYTLSAADTSDIIDLKRFQLENGEYTLRVELLDVIGGEILYDHTQSFVIDYQKDKFKQSDLYLSLFSPNGNDQFKKHGVCLEPVPFNYCQEQKQLSAYSEFYYLPRISTEDVSVGMLLYEGGKNLNRELIKKVYKRISPADYLPILLSMDISDVPTGDYHVVVETATKDKTIISSKESNINIYNPEGDLKRLNSYNKEFENSFVQALTKEELNYNLKALYPRVSNRRTDILNSVIHGSDLKVKRYFLYRYWTEQSLEHSEELFNQYRLIAEAVDRTYNSNVGKGFETDRGYIFLRYGQPSEILSIEDEPTAPPYEIWRYNQLPETGQNNVKFLFYNPSLSTNDYALLHSTCRGERQNPRWELELYRDDPNSDGGNGVDVFNATDGFNRNARRFFEEF